MIVLGSGGHTAEMLKLISNLDMRKYQPRVYVTAATDAMSERKAHAFEGGLARGDPGGAPGYRTAVIPRSREVGQSWTSSAFSTAHAMLYAAALVFKERPDLVRGRRRRRAPPPGRGLACSAALLAPRATTHSPPPSACPPLVQVLVNGPGTCIPVCVSAFVARWDCARRGVVAPTRMPQSAAASVELRLGAKPVHHGCLTPVDQGLFLTEAEGFGPPFTRSAHRLLGLAGGRIVYVESIARVYRLSLSGKILYHLRLASLFFVQVWGWGGRQRLSGRPERPEGRRD